MVPPHGRVRQEERSATQNSGFSGIKQYATRETHHIQSPFLHARAVPHNMKKTIFDAWNGYHSIPIREADRHLTTLITPWGRYRYKTAPQGYIALGDGYTWRCDEIVADIKNKTNCIDDTLIWAPTIKDSFFRAVCGWIYVGEMTSPSILESLNLHKTQWTSPALN